MSFLPELTDRQRRILARLVAEYIEQGEPISSGWLVEHSALGLSSATVRSVMARLEEQGLLRQPHTSAGRVPTDSAYRVYVDRLLGARKPPRPLPDIEARLRRAGRVEDMLEDASQELSRASHQIGLALAPASPTNRLRHIEFVSLGGSRILVIVVATGSQVTHRVIDMDEGIDAAVLIGAANYINAEFAGLTLIEARAAIVERMRQERILYDALMARALKLASAGLDDVPREDVVSVQGASYLLGEFIADPSERDRTIETLRALLRMIEEKHRVVSLLTECIESTGVTVVIGSEHASPELQSFSLVASTFTDGPRTGAVGVIGPTRMRYQRAIAVVESLSHAMTRVLEKQ
jgi:heat-inducible transcriptional repressor